MARLREVIIKDTHRGLWYEDGVLKPVQPLPLKEQERVELVIKPKSSWVEETAGIIGWTGSREGSDHRPLVAELALAAG